MRDFVRFFDKPTFLVILLLNAIGIILIYSASHHQPQPYYFRQLLWTVFSLVMFFLVFSQKLDKIFQRAFLFLVLTTGALVLQLLVGHTVAGTKSWIRIGSVGLQFSEFTKVALALYLAKFLTTFTVINWRVFFKLLALIMVPVVLVSVQPDLGGALILCSFFPVILLLKRIKIGVLLITIVLVGFTGYVAWTSLLKPYQKNRIFTFLNPEKYQKSTGYHVIQSKIAIGSGGLAGKGYLNGSQSQYEFLPTRHTDFIVSVAGEEFGFLGISFILLLYFVLFYRQYNFRFQNDEEFYFVILFNSLVFFKFLVNVLMVIGVIPVLGIPLPFVSYGGSSLLSLYLGEALIFRVKINNYLV